MRLMLSVELIRPIFISKQWVQKAESKKWKSLLTEQDEDQSIFYQVSDFCFTISSAPTNVSVHYVNDKPGEVPEDQR